jgi:hypothetical protein
MELERDFAAFLSEIRPTENQRQELQTGHETLRKRLRAEESLEPVLVSDFLQGSFKRSTAVRPKNDKRSDVDIVVVTRLSEKEHTPADALNFFEPFLNKHYKGKWRRQGRSFGISLSYVELDLVPTSAPSEAQEGILKAAAVTSDDTIEMARDWRLHPSWMALSARMGPGAEALLKEARAQAEWQVNPLRIPDREANRWEFTHPIEQIRWTRDKNSRTNRHFVNVVKAIKWWRLDKHETPEHPKGFPLERLVGECCPDGINTVAEGVARTLEEIVAKYGFVAQLGGKPQLPDYGVPSHDVFNRVSRDDFKTFCEQAAEAATLARRALDEGDRTASGNLWRELLGNKFPKPPNGGGAKKAGYTPPVAPAIPGSGRFA